MFNEIIISRANLINNIKVLKRDNPHSKICVMVKANAYGVGMHEVVSVIDDYVDMYGVSNVNEARDLCSITGKDILIVGPLDEIDECARLNVQVSCHSLRDAKVITNANVPIKVHIKINTGMNRYGIRDKRELNEVMRTLKSSRAEIVGIFTHFATTDEYVDTQMTRFLNLTKGKNLMLHADNSAVNEWKNHNLDMIRIGYNMYNQNQFGFKPVVNIKSKIVQINVVKKGELVGYDSRYVAEKKRKVAIIPIGYADGFDMRYIGSSIFYRGHQCKILNVCMDCYMLDVTDVDASVGDEIYILDKKNTLAKYAEILHTSEYEVMTKFGTMRAKRIIYD